MPLNYIKLKDFLTLSQKESLLKQAHETTDWIVHKSSKSGRLSPLHFKRIDTHIINDKELLIPYGHSIHIPLGAKHRMWNKEEKDVLKVVEVQVGSYFGEDDIIRYQDDYER